MVRPSRRRRFSSCTFDLRTGELTRHGVRLRLEHQPKMVLRLLIEANGDLVTRSQLFAALWQGESEGDFDRRLDKAIAKLRFCLQDNPQKPRYIETLRGLGYRLLVKVSTERNGSSKENATTPVEAPPSIQPVPERIGPEMREAPAMPPPAHRKLSHGLFANQKITAIAGLVLAASLLETLAASARTGCSQAILFVHLDDLKTVNDTLGHQTGDLPLREITQSIAARVREADTVGRLGEDEFVVMLTDLSEVPEEAAAQAKAVGERLLAAIGQPYLLDGRECRSAASIGITVFGDYREGTNEVLQQADIALYQAKAAGGNTIRFFSPALQAAVHARAAMEEDHRQGIKTNQFLLYYQPQVNRGRLIGAEALLRWMHPRHGILLPGEFISSAEDTGLILPLGNWILETVCGQIAAWADRKETAHISVAVNISALQLRQPDFVESVLTALDRTGANPQNLKLELTESMLADNIEDVIAKMTSLKSHGLRFCLDDFGTGYSSLTYLKRLPLHQLKIDRSFVRDILEDASSGAILQAIISLSRAMGLLVIAEGVETEEQRGFLARLGCHSFQGYLFSRPLPLEEFQLLALSFAGGDA